MFKKIIFASVGLFAATAVQAAVLGVYSFTGDGNAAVDSQPANATFGPMTRVNVSPVATGNEFNSQIWSLGGQDVTEYVQYIITPDLNYNIALTQISFDARTDGNVNPISGAEVRVFIGSDPASGATPQASQSFLPGTSFSTVTFNFTDFNTLSPITVRFYAWGGDDSSDYMSLDNVTTEGDLTLVPEPVNVALACFGLAFVGIGLGRRLIKARR